MKKSKKPAISLRWIWIAIMSLLITATVVGLLSRSKEDESLTPGSATHPHVFNYGPDGETVWLGTHMGAFEYKKGKWTRTMPSLRQNDVMALEINPSDRENIIVSGHGFVKRTEDGGKTWADIEKGLPNKPKPNLPDAHLLTMDPNNPAHLVTLLAGQGDNVYESKDGGTTWSVIGTIPATSYSISFAPPNSSSILAGSESGLYRYDLIDGRLKETKLSNEPAYQVNTLADGRIIVLNEGGFMLTSDLETWEPLHIVLDEGDMPLGIKVSNIDPNRMLIVTQNLSVYESKDSGLNWSKQ